MNRTRFLIRRRKRLRLQKVSSKPVAHKTFKEIAHSMSLPASAPASPAQMQC